MPFPLLFSLVLELPESRVDSGARRGVGRQVGRALEAGHGLGRRQEPGRGAGPERGLGGLDGLRLLLRRDGRGHLKGGAHGGGGVLLRGRRPKGKEEVGIEWLKLTCVKRLAEQVHYST